MFIFAFAQTNVTIKDTSLSESNISQPDGQKAIHKVLIPIKRVYKTSNLIENNISDVEYTPYVDVTLYPFYDFNNSLTHGITSYTLAFVNSPHNMNACIPTWSNNAEFSFDNYYFSIKKEVKRFKDNNARMIISFGGAIAGDDELSHSCKNVENLLGAYRFIIKKTGVKRFDFDVEGDNLHDVQNIHKMMLALKKLQDIDKDIEISFTIPAEVYIGLEPQTLNLVKQAKEVEVKVKTYNLMLMDYGEAYRANNANKTTMADYSIKILKKVNQQFHTLYDTNTTHSQINGEYYYSLGAIAMIGQNDTKNEIFYINDAKKLAKFCKKNNIYKTSIWALNRDKAISKNEKKMKHLEQSSKLPIKLYGKGKYEFSKIFQKSSNY